MDMPTANVNGNDSKRNDFGGNRSSVSSEGFCENDDEIDEQQPATAKENNKQDETMEGSVLSEDSNALSGNGNGELKFLFFLLFKLN